MRSTEEQAADHRPPADIERAARRRLEASAYAALKAVQCSFRHGTLILNGRVPTCFHKQLAQETVRTLPGIVEIANRLSVRREAAPAMANRW